VTAGQNVTAIDASLVAGASVSGRVTAGGAPLTGVCVSVSGNGLNSGDATTDGAGNYRISSLPADSYTVEFDPTCVGTQPSPYAPQYYRGVFSYSSATPVTVSAGQNVTAIDANWAVPPGGLSALVPARVLDTRTGNGASGPVAARGTVHLQADGRGHVPASGVAAVILNVTVTDTQRAGHLTVYPDGAALPLASNLNFTAGQTVANLVVAPVGANGKVNIYNDSAGTVQIVADVSGWFRTLYMPTSRAECLEHAELVPRRIGEDHPGRAAVVALADLDVAGSESEEPLDLGLLVIGAEVEVEPVLHRLLLGHLEEEDVGGDAVLGAARRRLEHHLVGLILRAPPPESRLPESCKLSRPLAVDAQRLDSQHGCEATEPSRDLLLTPPS
jgi:hypothetical protein